MIRGKIQPKTDGRPEGSDCFKLKRAYLHREHVKRLLFQCDLAQWFSDVSTRDRPLTARVQHLREQLGRSRFSICAGDRNHGRVNGSPAQLELTHRFDLARRKICRQLGSRIDPRA